MAAERIKCRAKVSSNCYDGRPAPQVYEDGMEDDGTYRDGTVVCDPCYIALGQPLLADLDAAIAARKGA